MMDAHVEFRRAMTNQQMDAALAVFGQKLQPQLEEIGRQSASLVTQQNGDLYGRIRSLGGQIGASPVDCHLSYSGGHS